MQFPLCMFFYFFLFSLLFYALNANDKLNTRERQSAMSLLVISTCPARVPFPHGSFIQGACQPMVHLRCVQLQLFLFLFEFQRGCPICAFIQRTLTQIPFCLNSFQYVGTRQFLGANSSKMSPQLDAQNPARKPFELEWGRLLMTVNDIQHFKTLFLLFCQLVCVSQTVCHIQIIAH